MYNLMMEVNDHSRKIMSDLNYTYHTKEEIIELFSRLIGKKLMILLCYFHHFILILVRI